MIGREGWQWMWKDVEDKMQVRGGEGRRHSDPLAVAAAAARSGGGDGGIRMVARR